VAVQLATRVRFGVEMRLRICSRPAWVTGMAHWIEDPMAVTPAAKRQRARRDKRYTQGGASPSSSACDTRFDLRNPEIGGLKIT